MNKKKNLETEVEKLAKLLEATAIQSKIVDDLCNAAQKREY